MISSASVVTVSRESGILQPSEGVFWSCYSVVKIVLELDERVVGKRCVAIANCGKFFQELRKRSVGERWFLPVGEMQVIEGRKG